MRLIDADALRASAIKATSNTELAFDNCFPYWQFSKCIKEAPTINAVPVVRGEWKRGREFSSYPRVPFIGDAYYCSNCEEEAYWDTDYGQQLFGFCPNCGAKMDKESENNA
jgi:hypothetical protein